MSTPAGPATAGASVPASLRYRRASVRDLAWLVLDGALTVPASSGALDVIRLDDAERAEFLEILAEWDDDSTDAWVQAVEPRAGLGIYVERLLGAWLQRSRLIRLLAANWPLRTGGITLGEADFLVRRQGQPGSGLQLWEVACKIYLGLPGGAWVGPGLNDSLDAKLSRIRTHQLRLIDRDGFREAWGTGWTAQAWMAGWLLAPVQDLPSEPCHPSGEPPLAARSQSPAAARIPAVWAEVGQPGAAMAERHARALGVSEWWVLPRRWWLRPVFADEQGAQRFDSLPDTLAAAMQDATGAPRPLMLAGIRWMSGDPAPVAVETIRLMLVPAGWTPSRTSAARR